MCIRDRPWTLRLWPLPRPLPGRLLPDLVAQRWRCRRDLCEGLLTEYHRSRLRQRRPPILGGSEADARFTISKASTSRSLRAVVEPPGRLTRNPSPLSFLRRLNLVEVVDIALGILPAHHLTAHRDLHGYQVCDNVATQLGTCLLYTSPSPRDRTRSRMPSSA